MLPLAIGIPFLINFLVALSGILISFYGIGIGVPVFEAAILSCLVAFVIALRCALITRKTAFVYLAILALLFAYQFSPALFSELAKSVARQASAGLNENRLPLAFYGVSYVPFLLLIFTASLLVIRTKREDLIALIQKPIQLFATVLAGILIFASFTHLKAVFLIPLIHAILFLVFAIGWKDRRYAIAGLLLPTLSVAFLFPFLELMFGWKGTLNFALAAVLVWGILLTSIPFDSMLFRIPIHRSPTRERGEPNDACFGIVRYSGRTIGVIAISCWLVLGLADSPYAADRGYWMTGAIGIAWCFVNAMRHPQYTSGLTLAGLTSVFIYLVATCAKLDSQTIYFCGMYSSQLVSVGLYLWITFRYRSSSEPFQAAREAGRIPSIDMSIRTKNDNKGVERAIDNTANGTIQKVNAFDSLIAACCDVSSLIALSFVPWNLYELVRSTFWFESLDLVATGSVFIWGMIVSRFGYLKYIVPLLNSMLPFLVSSATVAMGVESGDLRINALIWSGTIATVMIGSSVWSLWNRRNRSRSERPIEGESPCSLEFCIWGVGLAIAGLIPCGWILQIAGFVVAMAMALCYRPKPRGIGYSAIVLYCNALVWMFLLPLIYAPGHLGHGLEQGNLSWIFTIYGRPAIALPLTVLLLAMNRMFLGFHRARMRNDCVGTVDSLLTLVLGGMIAYSANQAEINSMGFWMLTTGTLVSVAIDFREAIQLRNERRVWSGIGMITVLVVSFFQREAWFVYFEFLLVGFAITHAVLSSISNRISTDPKYSVFYRPVAIGNVAIPSLIACVGLWSLLFPYSSFSGIGVATAVWITALVHVHIAWNNHSRREAWIGILLFNLGIAVLNRYNGWSDFQLYFVPVGASVIGLTEIMREQISNKHIRALRLVGANIILASPMFGVVHESWWHMLTLMVLSVAMVLVSIGLRVRGMMYSGVTYLVMDLIAVLLWSAVRHPEYLWVGSLILGGGVIGIAATCEIYRERLLSRIRYLSAELSSWN